MQIQVLNRYPSRPMLARRYWQPFQEIETMRRQFDRLLDDLTAIEPTQTSWAPAIELQDTGDAFTLRAQLPGMTAKVLSPFPASTARNPNRKKTA